MSAKCILTNYDIDPINYPHHYVEMSRLGRNRHH